jgi:hypothetical protein
MNGIRHCLREGMGNNLPCNNLEAALVQTIALGQYIT